jgi:hypothetical protein
VNRRDPSGLDYNGGPHFAPGPIITLPPVGVTVRGSFDPISGGSLIGGLLGSDAMAILESATEGIEPEPQSAQHAPPKSTCERLGDDAQSIANSLRNEYPNARDSWLLQQFNKAIGLWTYGSYFAEGPLGGIDSYRVRNRGISHPSGSAPYSGQDGFAPQFWDTDPDPRTLNNPATDQVHHFGAFFSAGLANHSEALAHNANDNQGDVNLGNQAFALGGYLRRHPGELTNVASLIGDTICRGKSVPR